MTTHRYDIEQSQVDEGTDEITKQKKAEETIHHQSNFLEIVKESLTHPFYVIDANDYTVIMANKSSGFGSLVGDPKCYTLTHKRDSPCDGKNHPCPIEEVKASKKPVIVKHIHYDGNDNARLLEIHAYPIFDSGGNVIRIIEYDLDITERDRAEKKLIRSESHYRSLFEYSPISLLEEDFSMVKDFFDAIHETGITDFRDYFETNPQDVKHCVELVRVLDVNKTSVRFYGVQDKSELIGPLPKNFGSDGLGVFREELIALAEGQIFFQSEEVILKVRGENRVLIIQLSVPPGYEDSLAKVHLSVIDVSEQYHTKIALKASEKRYRELISSSPDGISIIDLKENIIFANQAFSNMLGYSLMDLVGMNISDLVLHNDFEMILEETKKRISGGASTYEVNMIRKDGTRIVTQVSSVPQRNDSGQVTNAISVISDITRRKLVEDALRKSEASLVEAQRIAQLGSWTWDLATNELSWSDEMYRIVDIAKDKFPRTFVSFLDLVHFADKANVRKAVDAALKEKQKFNIEHRIIQSNGSIHTVQTQGEVAFDNRGDPIRMIGTVLDVTERKQVEQQLQRVTKRALLYLDVMGHDVSNQLQIISMSNALIQEKTILSDISDMANIIDFAVQKCESIISKIRYTEQLTRTPLVERLLDQVLSDCIELFRRQHEQVHIELMVSSKNAVILADKFLEHLLYNLIENAIMHNPNKQKAVWIQLQSYQNGYEISIADNGQGMPDSIRLNLFNPIQRYGGVGLHQAKGIIEKYRGRIEVSDRKTGSPECGSSFRIWFPQVKRKHRTRDSNNDGV